MLGIKDKKTQLLSEKEVLQKLDIPNFRHMSKEKIMEFTSLIPNMEPEVAKCALQQFPNFTQMASQVVSCYKDVMLETLKSNSLSTKSFMESCDTVIDALKPLLNEKLSFNQKKEIIDKIMEILKMKNDKDSEQKQWLGNIVKTASITATAIVAIVGSIIGVNIKLKK